MNTLLISIKKKYVDKLILNEKCVEYRKSFPWNVEKIIIYESKGSGKIIGTASVKEILKDTKENIWNCTSKLGGITEAEFYTYFKEKEFAYAIFLENLHFYESPKELSEYFIQRPPQNYIWIER